MRIFADTSEVLSKETIDIILGVTTNPSLIAKKPDVKDVLGYLLERSIDLGRDRDISVQVASNSYNEIVHHGFAINYFGNVEHADATGSNWVVKVPINTSMDGETHIDDGYRAIRTLANAGIRVNATLVFSVRQALAAAYAGAKFISPFIGRIDDLLDRRPERKKSDYYQAHGYPDVTDENGIRSGIDLIKRIDCELVQYGLRGSTSVLAASVRNPRQVIECKRAGADIATIPVEVLQRVDFYKLNRSRFDPRFLLGDLNYSYVREKLFLPDEIGEYVNDNQKLWLVHQKGIEGMVAFAKDTSGEYRRQLISVAAGMISRASTMKEIIPSVL